METGLSGARTPPGHENPDGAVTCNNTALSYPPVLHYLPERVPSASAGNITSASPLQQPNMGPFNELHLAATVGSTKRAVALLSSGLIDIDQGNPMGATPLMCAAFHGHSQVVGILLNKGANVSLVDEYGATALHLSAQEGDLSVSEMLIEAGADLEGKTSKNGGTPLHLAATNAHSEVMKALIKAGADPNSRAVNGVTPLHVAAQKGHLDAIKLLLRAHGDPLLTKTESGGTFTPLDTAAAKGHSEVVRWMIQEVGIEGCGGASGGVDALCLAAMGGQVDTMAMLTDAGVVDTGKSLINAAGHGNEASVKFLLQQDRNNGDAVAYVNTCDDNGLTPLYCAVTAFDGNGSLSPRVVRLLLDAGADTKKGILFKIPGGRIFRSTHLAFATRMLSEKEVGGQDATQDQLDRLEGIRRLLMRAEAVNAVSWLWFDDTPSIHQTVEGTTRTRRTSPPVTLMLPLLRRRAARPRMLLGAVFRFEPLGVDF